MSIVLNGTTGITTPDLSSGPVEGTTGTFSGDLSGTTANFSGDVTLGSSVLATPTGSAPSYTCRAWVNFNGTGTVAIRASGNVSSITDNGTGLYRVNFTTAMPDGNYSAVVSTHRTVSWADGGINVFDYNTSNVTVQNVEGAVVADTPICSVAIFR